jgi:hypothetical protein
MQATIDAQLLFIRANSAQAMRSHQFFHLYRYNLMYVFSQLKEVGGSGVSIFFQKYGKYFFKYRKYTFPKVL